MHPCIDAQVDPDFNIYEAALPWAIQRAISPTTPAGAATLRSTLLTDENKVQWARFEELVQEAKQAAAADGGAAETQQGAGAGRQGSMKGSVTPLESVKTVMAMPEGRSLRRIARDVDLRALALQMAAPSSRSMRRLAVDSIAAAMASQAASVDKAAAAWPLSEVGAALRQRRLLRLSSVVSVLVRSHAQRLVNGGWRGLAGMGVLVWLTLRIGLVGLAKGLLTRVKLVTRRASHVIMRHQARDASP